MAVTARDALTDEAPPARAAPARAGRVETRDGMVERRGAGLWLTHALLILGVLVIAFPIWLAFVASTVTQAEIVRPPGGGRRACRNRRGWSW